MKKLLWAAFGVALMTGASGCVIDDTYASCFDSSDCNDLSDRCWAVTTPAGTSGSFCSSECGSDAACESNFGFAGACYGIGSDPTLLCYQTCVVDSDCYSTSVCIEVMGAGFIDYICVPDN